MTAEVDPDNVERRARLSDLQPERLDREHPITSRIVREVPEETHDLVEEMSLVERTFRAAGTRYDQGNQVLEFGDLGWRLLMDGKLTPQDQFRLMQVRTAMARNQRELEQIGANGAIFSTFAEGEVGQGFENLWLRTVGATAEFAPMMLGSTVARLEGAAAGALGGALAGIKSGPGALVFAASGARIGGQMGSIMWLAKLEAGAFAAEMHTFRDEFGNPIDPDLVRAVAFPVGIINGLLENLGVEAALGPLVGRIAGGTASKEARKAFLNPVFRRVVTNFVADVGISTLVNAGEEFAQSIVSSLGKAVVDQGGDVLDAILSGDGETLMTVLGNPDLLQSIRYETRDGEALVGYEALIAQALDEAAEGALGGAGMAVVTSTAGQTLKEGRIRERTLEFADRMDRKHEATKFARLRERNPEKHKQLVRETLASTNQSPDVIIDREGFLTLFQDPAELGDLEQSVEGLRESIAEGEATGSDIVLDAGEFWTTLAHSEKGQEIVQHLRASYDAPTVAQLKQVEAEATKQAEELGEEASTAAVERASRVVEVGQEVFRAEYEQQRAAGKPAEEAQINAEISRRHFFARVAGQSRDPIAVAVDEGLVPPVLQEGREAEGRIAQRENAERLRQLQGVEEEVGFEDDDASVELDQAPNIPPALRSMWRNFRRARIQSREEHLNWIQANLPRVIVPKNGEPVLGEPGEIHLQIAMRMAGMDSAIPANEARAFILKAGRAGYWNVETNEFVSIGEGEAFTRAVEGSLDAQVLRQHGVDENPFPVPGGKEAAERRVNNKLKRKPAQGRGFKNAADTGKVDQNGHPVMLGDVTPQQIIDHATSVLTPEEIEAAAQWYDEVVPAFFGLFGEDAPEFIVAWLMANQNESPAGAFRNMLRVREQVLLGIHQRPLGGLADARLRDFWAEVLSTGMDQLESIAGSQKLNDFLDAGLKRRVRRWMDDRPEAGEPAVIDIHSARGNGWVDEQYFNALRRIGVDMSDVTIDLKGAPTEAQYERAAEKLHEVRDLANETNAFGFPIERVAQIQAIQWVAILKQLGMPDGTAQSALDASTREISVALMFGDGAPLAEVYPQLAELPFVEQENLTHVAVQKALQLALELNGKPFVRGLRTGAGGWLGEIEPSTTIELVASPETSERVAATMGRLLQQTAARTERVLSLTKSGAIPSAANSWFVDIWGDDRLGDSAGQAEFWSKLRAADGDDFFTPDALEAAQRSSAAYKTSSRLIYLTPEEFLGLVEQGLRDASAQTVERIISEGGKFDEIPQLDFTHDGMGRATVTSHEGRHRARALADRGVTRMPVLLNSEFDRDAGGAKLTDNEDPRFIGDVTVPTVLESQDARGTSIEFPLRKSGALFVPKEERAHTSDLQGFHVVEHDGKPGIRIGFDWNGFDGKRTKWVKKTGLKRLQNEVIPAIVRAVEASDYEVSLALNPGQQKTSTNDWTENKHGQGYDDRLAGVVSREDLNRAGTEFQAFLAQAVEAIEAAPLDAEREARGQAPLGTARGVDELSELVLKQGTLPPTELRQPPVEDEEVAADMFPELASGERGRATLPAGVGQAMINRIKARGRATLPAGVGQAMINMTKASDFSTWIHESAHVYFWQLTNDVRRGFATEQQTRDLQTIRDWLQVPDDRDELTVAEQEQFAEGFERFFQEGVAPSIALHKAFRYYRQWITIVYEGLRPLSRELSDEVREVMGRMVSSEAEVDRAEVMLGLGEAPTWMTEEEVTAFEAVVEPARAKARAESMRRKAQLVREKKRELRGEALKEREALTEETRREVVAEMSNQPVWLAKEQLAATPDIDRTVLADMVGATEDDLAAELERVGETTFEETADRETARRVRAKLGRIPRLADFEGEARDLVMEGDALRGLMELDKAISSRAGVPVTPLQVLKTIADAAIGNTVVRRLQPEKFRAAAARESRLAAEAAERGDWSEAKVHHRSATLAALMEQRARKARERARDASEFGIRAQTPSVQQRLTKAGNGYVEKHNSILERFDFRPRTDKSRDLAAQSAQARAISEMTLDQWMEVRQGEGDHFAFDASEIDGVGPKHWRDLTVDQLNGVRDALKNLQHLAANENRILAKQARENFEARRDAIVSRIRRKPARAKKNVRVEEIKNWKQFFAAHLKMEFLFIAMDGLGDGRPGIIHETLFQPLADADAMEQRLLREKAKEVRDLRDKHYTKAQLRENAGKMIFIPEIDRHYRFEEIQAVALNMGNPYNYDAMLRGMGWTPQQAEAIVSHLDANDGAFIQGLLDIEDSLWPMIEKLQRELTGVQLEKVEASPMTIGGKEFRGGYHPLKGESLASEKVAMLEEKQNVKELFANQFGYPATRKGHTHARKFWPDGRELRLSLDVFDQHISEAIHDLAYRKAIIDANKMLSDPAIRSAVVDTFGLEVYREFRPWLNDIARDQNFVSNADSVMAPYFRKARLATTVMYMGAKWTTMLSQPAGLFNAADFVGTPDLLKAIAHTSAHLPSTIEFVFERSEFMKNRMQTWDRDVRDILGKGDFQTKMSTFWLGGVGVFDMAVSIPTWMAAYNKELADSGNTAKAATAGDRAVRLSQGSGAAQDLARIQRGTELFKNFTMFASYWMTNWNQFALRYQEARREGLSSKMAYDVFRHSLLLWIFPIVAAELMSGRGPEEDEDEVEWMLVQLGRAPFNGLIGVRSLMDYLFNIYEGRNWFGFQASPTLRIAEDFGVAAGSLMKFAEEGEQELSQRAERSLFNLFGFWLHLPTAQMWITFDNLRDWYKGETDFQPRDVLFTRPEDRR